MSMIKKKYSGIIVPAITPLTPSFQIDEKAVAKLFHSFYQHDVAPFILGTTGESASLPFELKKDYIKIAAAHKQNNSMLYVGIGATVIEESVMLAKFSADNGVDAVAATLPYYYELSYAAMQQFFEDLANAIPLPLIIYNIPATTHMSIPLEVIDALSNHPNIVAVKDSERSEVRLSQSLELWRHRDDFSHLMGWAGKSAQALQQGSDGLIPSTGNFAPAIYANMWKAHLANHIPEMEALQLQSDEAGNLYQQGKSLGESLWALKVLIAQKGIGSPIVMPPLMPMNENEKEQLLTKYKNSRYSI
jgi:dihydrodipicolinate synthase/N-acetylneuraminate lyase